MNTAADSAVHPFLLPFVHIRPSKIQFNIRVHFPGCLFCHQKLLCPALPFLFLHLRRNDTAVHLTHHFLQGSFFRCLIQKILPVEFL